MGAALFWSSEGAIAVGYPSESQRGRLLAVWLAMRNVGPLITGIITLVLNTSGAETGKVAYKTYYALIVIQCLGVPASLLISKPDKVIRPDGTRIPYLKKDRTSVKKELRHIWDTLRTPQLIPIFITGVWGQTYQSNFVTAVLSVRSRALVGLLTSIVSILADISFGVVADAKWLGSQARRARCVWLAFAMGITGLWVWQTVTQVHFTRTKNSVDWAGATPEFNNAIAVVLLWKYVPAVLTTDLPTRPYWHSTTGSSVLTLIRMVAWNVLSACFARSSSRATAWPMLSAPHHGQMCISAFWLLPCGVHASCQRRSL